MAFPELFLDELLKKNDIAEVVGNYVRLSKKSGNNLFGLCPFHSEKTPSFSVSTEKQLYKCFGCGKGGGVVNFIMDAENLSYPDAVHFLAKRVGMTVPDDKTSQETLGKRARLLELNKDAARYFYSLIATKQGIVANQYIEKRRISKAMVTRFGLGAAPDSWTALFEAMTKKGYTREELLNAGLVKLSKKDNTSVYDTFRNRLMFPVIDVRGNIVGFSGRILGDGEPKYLNSPDTPVFDKSRNLFALNLAKKTKSGMLILTEGNIDVVALHQAGFDGAVASLGTSLTETQTRLMSQYQHIRRVVIAYDSDAAGIKASQRAIGLLERVNLDVRVLRMEGAKDPDEFINKFGKDKFGALLEHSEYHIDYRLLTLKNKHHLDTDDGRIKYLGEAIELLSRIDNAAEREIYSVKVSETAGVSREAIQNEIKKAFKRRMSADKKKQDRKELDIKTNIQPIDRNIRYESVYSAAAEEGILRLLTTDNELIKSIRNTAFKEDEFTSSFLKRIFILMCRRIDMGLEISPAAISSELDKAEAAHYADFIRRPESVSNGEKAMRDYIEKIRSERVKTKVKEDPLAVLQKYRDNQVVEDNNGSEKENTR